MGEGFDRFLAIGAFRVVRVSGPDIVLLTVSATGVWVLGVYLDIGVAGLGLVRTNVVRTIPQRMAAAAEAAKRVLRLPAGGRMFVCRSNELKISAGGGIE